ncbi:caspase family protein [Streptomyces sp. NPDC089799]|uniref:caspase family protein n=1 Tax=Streptomyces sp. NPDC089799 TaxID=3155066 RepID=UPI00342FE973
MNDSHARHALIIANDAYEDPGLRQLVSPAEDAIALAAVLADPKVGNFDVQVSRNEPRHATERKIEDFFEERKHDDALILHFSCHGLKSESGELFFAAADTLHARLKSTAVAAEFVRRCMTGSRAGSKVLFLDCCYGGAFSHSMTMRSGEDVHVLEAFAGPHLGGGRGWAVITASSAMEYAFEGTELSGEFGTPKPSVFTSALVRGLTTGEADRDEDGLVSLDELYEYVYDRVRQENPRQTPSRTVNLQGDLYLAQSGRKRIKPAPLPDDLREAIASPNVFSRRGAIAELRTRMTSGHLEIAAGAHEALTEMSQREIQWVAEEANAALRGVALRPEPARLEFGMLVQGAERPHREVLLSGPPLARQCEARAEDDRIVVERSAAGLDVWVDTGRAGSLKGSVALKGPTGEATVEVRADIAPKPAPEAPPKVPREAPSETPPETPPKQTSEPPPKAQPETPPKETPKQGGRPRQEPPRQPSYARGTGAAAPSDASELRKRAVILSVCTVLAAVVSTVLLVISLSNANIALSDIQAVTGEGKAFQEAVNQTSPNLNLVVTEALVAFTAAAYALVLGHFTRRAVARAAPLLSGRDMKWLTRSCAIAVNLCRLILPMSLLLAIGAVVVL